MRSLLLLSALLLALPAHAEKPLPEEAKVVSVYDGDTLTLATGHKVRLRWINTPELRPLQEYAEEAREAATAFVRGKVVKLRYADPPTDTYGRLVADVHVGDESLEEHLLDRGLGHIMLIPPVDGDLDTMFEAQRRAREAQRGIWGLSKYQAPLHVTSFHANGRGDDHANPNVEYLRVCNISEEPLNLLGYTIENARKRSFVLPDIVIPPGHTVKIHSGVGLHQTDAQEQLAVHLQSKVPLWNDRRDQATIRDPDGEVVVTRKHQVKSR